MRSDDLLSRAADELERLLPQTTPGIWKIWAMTVLADEEGTSNVETAKPVAYTVQALIDEQGQPHPRTFDAEWICRMQPVVGRALVEVLRQQADAFDEIGFPSTAEVEAAFPIFALAREILQEPVDAEDLPVQPATVQNLLSLVEDEFPAALPTVEQIEHWPLEVKDQVIEWAVAVHLVASDNEDVEIPPRPAVLG